MSFSVLASWLALSASLTWPNLSTLDDAKIQWTVASSDIPTLIHPDEHTEICQTQAERLAGQFLQIANQALSYSLTRPESVTVNLQKVPASTNYKVHAILRYSGWYQDTQSKWFINIVDMHPAAPIESVSIRFDTLLKTYFTDVTCWNLWN